MYSYITKELPSLLAANFPTLDMSRMGVTGHSMGGHGALTLALKNQDMFKSVSAFSPICNPMNCPWGKKAFTNYLGADQREWEQYDATELIKLGKSRFDSILIDIGTSDSFLSAGQLLPEMFSAAAEASDQKIELRMQDGYDHSYYFVSTFIEDHVKFHKCRLV
jgi:S-formylglutathione hydrolase